MELLKIVDETFIELLEGMLLSERSGPPRRAGRDQRARRDADARGRAGRRGDVRGVERTNGHPRQRGRAGQTGAVVVRLPSCQGDPGRSWK